MKPQHISNTALYFLAILAIPTLFFCTNLPLYNILGAHYATNPNYAITNEQITGFLTSNTELPAEMTFREKSHMYDVRRVMELIFSVLISALLIGLWRLEHPSRIQDLQRGATLLACTIVLIAGVGLFGGFDILFSTFHEVFFKPGTWTFDANSLLISTYPKPFFISMSVLLFGSALLIASTTIVATAILSNNKS